MPHTCQLFLVSETRMPSVRLGVRLPGSQDARLTQDRAEIIG
jgi:hypothetical protein